MARDFGRLAFLAALIGFVLMMRAGLRFARTWHGPAVLASVTSPPPSLTI